MKRRIKLVLNGDYIYFTDVQNNNNLYCMTREVFNKNKNFEKIRFDFSDIQDDEHIEAFALGKVGNDINFDLYDIISSPISFPINQIKWICVYYEPK